MSNHQSSLSKLCAAAVLLLVLIMRMNAQVLAPDLDLNDADGRVTTCEAPEIAYNETCTCDAGYTWQQAQCVLCAAGFFKEEPGLHACTACPALSSSFEGAIEQDDCLCLAGYHSTGSVCEACAVGNYKSFVGNNSCVACPSNSSTLNNAANSLDDCICDVGYFTNTVAEAEACLACPQNTYTLGVNSASCLTCPADSGTSGPASTYSDCLCNAGFTQKNATYGETLCVACSKNFYKTDRNMQACTECPASMSSPTASEFLKNCTCNKAFQKTSPTTCELCAENWYCTGEDGKYACPDNSTSPRGSTQITDCTCLPSFFWYYGVCELCNEDHYCNNNTRTACPENSTAPVGSASIENCTCNPGFAVL